MKCKFPAKQLIVVTLLICVGVFAQDTTSLSLLPLNTPQVELTPYNFIAHSKIRSFVEGNPELAPLLPYSAVLINKTSKKIMALTVIWKHDGPSGTPVDAVMRQDSFFTSTNPISEGGELVFLTPSNNWSESSMDMKKGFSVLPARLQRDAVRFRAFKNITLELDTVIFDDGLVVGPDRSQTIEHLEMRKLATESFSRELLATIQSGGDPRAKIDSLEAQAQSLHGPLGIWYLNLRALFAGSPDVAKTAEQLSKLPSLKDLHR